MTEDETPPNETERFQREGHEGEIFAEFLLRTADRREAEFQARVLAGCRRDNARLRALIQDTHDRNGYMRSHGFNFCPWCGVTFGVDADHAEDCLAFTFDGSVR